MDQTKEQVLWAVLALWLLNILDVCLTAIFLSIGGADDNSWMGFSFSSAVNYATVVNVAPIISYITVMKLIFLGVTITGVFYQKKFSLVTILVFRFAVIVYLAVDLYSLDYIIFLEYGTSLNFAVQQQSHVDIFRMFLN